MIPDSIAAAEKFDVYSPKITSVDEIAQRLSVDKLQVGQADNFILDLSQNGLNVESIPQNFVEKINNWIPEGRPDIPRAKKVLLLKGDKIVGERL